MLRIERKERGCTLREAGDRGFPRGKKCAKN